MKFLNFTILTLILSISSFSLADTHSFQNASYKEAKKAESFLRFDMASTKFGLVTTSFEGFVKNYNLQGQLKDDELLAGASVDFATQDLDTDIDGRNEKMWNYCLDAKNNPSIRITLNSAVPLTGTAVQVPAVLVIRGVENTIQLTVKGSRNNEKIIFDLSGDLSIKDLHIPDPSIVIASVKDKIKVSAHIIIDGGQR